MDPNQQEPLMNLPISIKHGSLQYHTSMIIDFTTNLNFVSQEFLTQNNLLEKCTRGKINVVRIANEQRISTSKTFLPTDVSLGY
jgi:hypothetical protein